MNLEEIAKYVLGGSIPTLLIVIYVVLNPEVFEKWATWAYRLIYIVTSHGSKKIVKHDIQGRVNEFSKVLSKELPNYEPVRINIQWIKTDETAMDFFNNNKLVIRMHHHREQDKNFVGHDV